MTLSHSGLAAQSHRREDGLGVPVPSLRARARALRLARTRRVGVATAGETLDLDAQVWPSRAAITSMPCSFVAVFATERIRHPSDTRAVTRNAWTLAWCATPHLSGPAPRRPRQGCGRPPRR